MGKRREALASAVQVSNIEPTPPDVTGAILLTIFRRSTARIGQRAVFSANRNRVPVVRSVGVDQLANERIAVRFE